MKGSRQRKRTRPLFGVNGAVCSKKNLTEPTLLEMSGTSVNQDLTRIPQTLSEAVAECDCEQQDTSGLAVCGSSPEFVRSTANFEGCCGGRSRFNRRDRHLRRWATRKRRDGFCSANGRRDGRQGPFRRYRRTGTLPDQASVVRKVCRYREKRRRRLSRYQQLLLQRQQNSPHNIVAFPSIGN